ncbi:MAG TPA: oligosaccharide flippase family protein [Polyangiaceae bacterium]|nr:oligosaccharide flippase family protein [Polyangiaceae bacterium]
MRLSRNEVASSVGWSVAENGGLALVSFASLVIYSRFLSPADFGVFSIALATIELFGVLVGMLFHDALVQRAAVTQRHFDTAFTFSLVLSLVLLAVAVAFSPVLGHLVHHRQAAGTLAATALSLPFTALTSTIVAQQRRELSFRALAVRSLTGRLCGAAVGIGLVVAGAGVWGLVAQQVLMAAVGSAVLWFSAKNRPQLGFGLPEFRELFAFGLYSVSALFLLFAAKRIFTIWAGVLLGADAAGYLNLAFRAVDVLWALAATAVSQVALPALSRFQADPEALRRMYRSALGWTCLALYPVFIGLALVAPEAVALLFGKKWLASSPYVAAIACLIVLQAPRLLATPTLTALGKPRAALVAIGAELVVAATLLSTLGAPSLTVAVGIWMAREVVAMPVAAFVLRRVAGIPLRDQAAAPLVPLLCASVMAAGVYGLGRALPQDLGAAARLLISVAAGGVLFALCVRIVDRSKLQSLVDILAPLWPRAAVRSTPGPALAPGPASLAEERR